MIDLDKMHSDLLNELESAAKQAKYSFLPYHQFYAEGKMHIIDQMLGILEGRNA